MSTHRRWKHASVTEEHRATLADIPDQDFLYLLRFILIKARQRWAYDGEQCPFEEYVDAGYEALVRSLERFVPRDTCRFVSFARVAIQWDIHMTWRRYRHWKWGRTYVPTPLGTVRQADIWIDAATKLAQLPAIAAGYRAFVLDGRDDVEYAAAEGISKAAVYSRLRSWRQWQ